MYRQSRSYNEQLLLFIILKAMILPTLTLRGCPYCFVGTAWQRIALGSPIEVE